MTTTNNKPKPVYSRTDFVNGGYCLTVKIQRITTKIQEGGHVEDSLYILTSEQRQHYWDMYDRYLGSDYTTVSRRNVQAEAIEDMLAQSGGDK